MIFNRAVPSLSDVDTRVAGAEQVTMVLGDEWLNSTLQRVVDLAKHVIGDVKEVSVMVVEGRQPRTAVSTGRAALQLDLQQYHCGFGPSMDAATTGQTVAVTTRGNNPYLDFSRAAHKAGITHVVCTPLQVPEPVLSALTFYVTRDQPFHDDLVTLAETFADYAAGDLANAALYQDVVDLSQQLKSALVCRTVIEQAKGILMAQHRCSDDAAFTKLVNLAQQRHLKLLDTAAVIAAELDKG